MNEELLRTMVRESIARHLVAHGVEDPEGPPPLALAAHPSHFRYALPASGGPCLIEPAVQCNHCGYCESHGH
jgi:hypothetical protein